jgi:two-component system, NarL family, sensor kinase
LLAQEDARLELKVIDDGVGFDAAAWWARGGAERADGSGFGLTGMRERAGAMGGRFRLASRPGGGTIVEVVLRSGAV